jgi:hypothetical protein
MSPFAAKTATNRLPLLATGRAERYQSREEGEAERLARVR